MIKRNSFILLMLFIGLNIYLQAQKVEKYQHINTPLKSTIIVDSSILKGKTSYYPSKFTVFWYSIGNEMYLRDTTGDLSVKNLTTGKWKIYNGQKALDAALKIIELNNKKVEHLTTAVNLYENILCYINTEGQIIDREKFLRAVEKYKEYMKH